MTKISWKITYLKFHSNLPGDNDLIVSLTPLKTEKWHDAITCTTRSLSIWQLPVPQVMMKNHVNSFITRTLIARFMGPTWGPSGADRTQLGPMLAPWTLLSGNLWGSQWWPSWYRYMTTQFSKSDMKWCQNISCTIIIKQYNTIFLIYPSIWIYMRKYT